MFRTLAAAVTSGPAELVKLHPAELTALLEAAWNVRRNVATAVGRPDQAE